MKIVNGWMKILFIFILILKEIMMWIFLLICKRNILCYYIFFFGYFNISGIMMIFVILVILSINNEV